MLKICGAVAGALAVVVPASPAAAQSSNVSPTNRYCWGENVGFMNWRDANGTLEGVRLSGTSSGRAVLSRFAWGENIGWINFGNGSPANGVWYQNVNGADAGVNMLEDGRLSGLAWGENVGWINFDGGALANPAQPARYDRLASRFRGYAWGENMGWINLDNADVYIGTRLCAADWDLNGSINSGDVTAFLNAWFADLVNGTTYANFDAQPTINSGDVSAFLSAWFAALAGNC